MTGAGLGPRRAFVAEVRSLAHVVGQTVRRTFQATCDAALGDARCGVDLEDPALKGAGAVIDLLRDRAFTAPGLGGLTPDGSLSARWIGRPARMQVDAPKCWAMTSPTALLS
ncbi:DUF2163 domain-containing protein [uncultured Jannaschia sp.]|uniref:baseplate hub domain-containing protein n=1 Tax=uncultured Jannaschia sp. TaxID=293347 RepID=UPI0026201A67|nr:DUF2163 domain-containing protein [uncultured Jannaschia sp.]